MSVRSTIAPIRTSATNGRGRRPTHDHHETCGCSQTPPPKPPVRRILDLAVGDFLLFEELACSGTAFNSTSPDDGGFDGKNPLPDVDRTHRHVVRLTRITTSCDALRGNRLLEVEWAREDALPFSLCISAIGTAPQCDLVRDMAVARGNVVLVDHGATINDEPLPPVEPRTVDEVCEGQDALVDVARIAARYRPRLQRAPLTFAEPLQRGASASRSLRQDPRAALPAIALAGIPHRLMATSRCSPAAFANLDVSPNSSSAPRRRRWSRCAAVSGPTSNSSSMPRSTDDLLEALDANLRALTETWTPRADLLDSGADDPAVVAEIDDDGVADLRFGDGDCGRAIEVGMAFMATYRVGNGRAGLSGRSRSGTSCFAR